MKGFYSQYGYRVVNDRGFDVYEAGNHKLESSEIVSMDSPNCLSLKDIRKFCIKTTKELAKEKGLVYCGVDKEESSN